MRVDVYRERNRQAVRQLDQTSGHGIIVRAGGILGADGDIRFLAAEIITHSTHIDSDKFTDLSGNPGSAVADLFIIGD
ncbi:hypothetical protein D3C73_1500800 [compost metagenome]